MNIGICSGYFQRFHYGHAEYLQTALMNFNKLLVIINNDVQQQRKYNKYRNLRAVKDIAESIKKGFPEVDIIESVDTDDTVIKTLEMISKEYKDDDLYFCKDADRQLDNIPEKDIISVLKINYLQFTNEKINSTTKIMEEENENQDIK